MGDNLPCGTYFVITDHLARPVIALNPSRQVAGLYDYDVSGYVNRASYQGDTAHPYANNTGTGCPSTTGIADLTEKPAASGMRVDLRGRFHVVDTESSSGYNYDFGQLVDGDNGTCLLSTQYQSQGSIGGYHTGAQVTGWVTPSAGHLKVGFYSDPSNCCPNGSGGINCSCSGGCSSCCTTCAYPYTGLSFEWGEYRQYQSGATPVMLPIRIPGQYYDAETDLHENWNRYYDPAIGRYLAPDPIMRAESPYPYAANNPIVQLDATGKSAMPYGALGGNGGDFLDTPGDWGWTHWNDDFVNLLNLFSQGEGGGGGAGFGPTVPTPCPGGMTGTDCIPVPPGPFGIDLWSAFVYSDPFPYTDFPGWLEQVGGGVTPYGAFAFGSTKPPEEPPWVYSWTGCVLTVGLQGLHCTFVGIDEFSWCWDTARDVCKYVIGVSPPYEVEVIPP